MKGMQSNIAYSMGKARRHSLTNKDAVHQPGPGGYKQPNLNSVKKENPKWSLKGKGTGEKYARDGPGPGQYSDGYKKFNTPNYSFGNKMSKTFYPDKSKIPGPGAYAQKTSLGKKGGYIGSRQQHKRKNLAPGPGQYSMRSTFSQKGAAFGQGKRSSPNLNKSHYNPGPGQYKLGSNFGNKTGGGGFGSGRSKKNMSKVPGPGQYSIHDSLYRDNRAASIKGRPQTSKVELKPGPGHYTSKSLHASPAFSIGVKTKLKELMGKENPGPGNYNPDFGPVKQSAPGVHFGTPGKGKIVGDSSMPGPGQYEVRSKAGNDAPSYGMRGRYEDHKGDMKPGPGNYNPKDEVTRVGPPGTVMGSGQRSNLGGKGDGPGPGNYDLNNKNNKGKEYSFGIGQRNDGSLEKRAKGLPGPGQYQPPSFMGNNNKGCIITGKPHDKAIESLPGPGAYQSPQKRNGPAYSLSGHRTEDPQLREKSKMPPPGCYNPDDSGIKHNSPGFVFGNEKFSELKGNGMPGPGQYDAKSTLEGKGVHIAGKIHDKIQFRAPGPGQYQPSADSKFKSGPAFSIGGVNGDMAIPTKGMPGPGTYDADGRPNTSGFTFGGEQRKGLAQKRDAPGPGAYTVPNNIGNDARGIVIAGKYVDKKDTNLVGPGQYTLPSSIAGPKYSMGAGEKGTKLNKNIVENPPPGSYNVDAGTGKQSAPGVVFGKDLRNRNKTETLPGPGNYPMPSTLANGGITIQGKYNEKIKERAPGPGQYKANMDPSKTHGGSIVFGAGKKGEAPKGTGAPGPGQYLIRLPYDKGPKFGQDLRDRPQKSDMPGPGQYNTRRQEGLTYF
eukprot:CAMPEP_0205819792 /NCGR_PEP_ID=MMETSP0206-20130828/2253_1 /ASSEMBLY_ACC=CAM_ASM_000279 /TAXON_ID=36767 /ORGANISM="Euplotes focardii, Strain TN1" /LENGTH=827 /DNA_ID=CAMNT_0053113753 /DNA_START=39 /DNA_END=2522 /DNA_ORIENTATION=-